MRILPPRGEKPKTENARLWRVTSFESSDGSNFARLTSFDKEQEKRVELLDDLVVVAEFLDPIYPGLVSTGTITRGGDKPFHTVISAENYHALQALLFTHRGAVDAIYIDPPYNTGAKDWKYNNDYVDSDDHYRHSKWLAMMERRLKLAKELLNPENSVLIVTIDEKEYLRLGLLLEQTFPGRKMQMVSSVINPRGIVRDNEFARSNEFIFFVWNAGAQIQAKSDEETSGEPIAWETMRRRSLAGARGRKGPGACGPNQFFPIFVESQSGAIVGRGDVLPEDVPVESIVPPPGCVAVFPARDDGTEMNWSLTDTTFDERWAKGYVRAGKATSEKPQKYLIQYVLGGVIDEINEGKVEVTGRHESGWIEAHYVAGKAAMPHSQWDIPSHNAQQNGTGLLRGLLPDRRFPYAKSLFAVEDALRFFVSNNRDATILDFFAGSGTTAHAVARLNKQDGGRRQSILVTNNEVSVDEQKTLREKGLRPGDAAWEAHGICEYITKPRIGAAITGVTPSGEPIEGAYKFTDKFPMADGFDENVEFFSLSYESAMRVASHREFAKIAPFLWLRAGSLGRRIDDVSRGWDVAEAYGVLAALDQSDEFLIALEEQDELTHAFILTDEDRLFEAMVRRLPDHVEPVRLYSAYLRNFEIETGRSA